MATALLQTDGDGDAGDEVDIADVGVELIRVERELCEAEVGGVVWVGGVEDRGLDEGGAAWVEQEGEFAVDDPDAAACDLRDGDGGGVAWAAERDGAVLLQWGADVLYFGGEVEVFAVGLEKAAFAVVLDGDARLRGSV